MKATITYLRTNKVETIEISEVFYTNEKIVLFLPNGGFRSFYHLEYGVKIEIK